MLSAQQLKDRLLQEVDLDELEEGLDPEDSGTRTKQFFFGTRSGFRFGRWLMLRVVFFLFPADDFHLGCFFFFGGGVPSKEGVP